MESAIPRRHMPQVLARMGEMSKAYGLGGVVDDWAAGGPAPAALAGGRSTLVRDTSDNDEARVLEGCAAAGLSVQA